MGSGLRGRLSIRPPVLSGAVYGAEAARGVGASSRPRLLASAAGTAPALKKPSAARPPLIHAGPTTSTYFGGYQATPSGGLASASATFTVPTAKCTPTDVSADAIEWNGVYTDTLGAYAFVEDYCTPTGPAYDYNFKTNAGTLTEPGAAPGDVVVTSLFQSATATEAEIHDLTTNAYWVAANSGNQGDTVVDIGTYNYAAYGFPIPTFSKIKFSNATVNGDCLGFDSPTQVNAVSGATVLIQAGGLTTTAAGSSFTDKFLHAS